MHPHLCEVYFDIPLIRWNIKKQYKLVLLAKSSEFAFIRQCVSYCYPEALHERDELQSEFSPVGERRVDVSLQ